MVSAIYSKIKLEKFQANNTTISQDHGYMKNAIKYIEQKYKQR